MTIFLCQIINIYLELTSLTHQKELDVDANRVIDKGKSFDIRGAHAEIEAQCTAKIEKKLGVALIPLLLHT